MRALEGDKGGHQRKKGQEEDDNDDDNKRQCGNYDNPDGNDQ